jgi:hypothetical protein
MTYLTINERSQMTRLFLLLKKEKLKNICYILPFPTLFFFFFEFRAYSYFIKKPNVLEKQHFLSKMLIFFLVDASLTRMR